MALPEVRGSKSRQTTTLAALTPELPVGTEIGDLVFIEAQAFGGTAATGATPTITVPEGWTILGGEQNDETTGARHWVLAYRKITSLTMPEWKTSSVAANSFNLYAFVIKKGTFSASTPIEANSAWTKGAASTSQTAAKATGTIGQSLAIAFINSPTTPKEWQAGWKQQGATQTSPGNEAAYKETEVKASESTGEPTYKKSTASITGWSIMVVVAPAGSFHTQEATQSQSTSLQRLVERVRPLLTQAQSSSLIRVPERILAATAKQVVSVQLGTLKQGEVTQAQIVSVQHSVIRNLQPVTQEQTSFVVRRPERTLMATAKQALTALASKTLFLPTVTQEQNSAAGFRNERIMRATNSQVASRGASGFVRILRTTQTQAANTHRSLVRAILSVTQTQVAQAGLTKFVFAQVTVKQVVSVSFKNFRKIGTIYAKVFGTEPKVYGDVE